MTATTTALICIDCGKPVHPVHGGEACGICGEPVWYHDSAADSMACPGGSGGHVQVTGTFAGARTSEFLGASVVGGLEPGGWNLAAPVTQLAGGRLADVTGATRKEATAWGS